MIDENNYEEEKNIIREVLKRSETGWTSESGRLVLQYLNPYIQDGIDTIIDDGYLLYVDDIKQEIMEEYRHQITDDDILHVAISVLFGDSQKMNQIRNRIRQFMLDKYENYAPVPKRSFQEYVKYADSPETRKEYEKSYQEYATAIQELSDFCSSFLNKIRGLKQTSLVQNQALELELFLNELEQLKSKDFFQSVTYQAYVPAEDIFYPAVFLSEDSKKVLEEVLNQPIDFATMAEQKKFHYSLEELYQAIPKDTISYELLENEEIDPDHNNTNLHFIQSFYQLALLFCSDEEKTDGFEEKVNHFLIQKVSNFQEQFCNSCSQNERDRDDDFFDYLSDKEYCKKHIS